MTQSLTRTASRAAFPSQLSMQECQRWNQRQHTRTTTGFGSLLNAAFGRSEEADLIDRLRAEGAVLLSSSRRSTAKSSGTFCSVNDGGNNAGVFGGSFLAPMAVLPRHQGRKIWQPTLFADLPNYATGRAYVIVLGHKDYYPRFWFLS